MRNVTQWWTWPELITVQRSRSLILAQIDSSHTTSYGLSIVTCCRTHHLATIHDVTVTDRDCNPGTIFQSRDFGIEKRQSRDQSRDQWSRDGSRDWSRDWELVIVFNYLCTFLAYGNRLVLFVRRHQTAAEFLRVASELFDFSIACDK